MPDEVEIATEPPGPKALSLRRFMGFVLLLGVMVVCGGIGLWLRRVRGSPGPAAVGRLARPCVLADLPHQSHGEVWAAGGS